MTPHVRIIGVGCHPDHLTEQARAALATCDYVIAAAKSDGDQLLAFRRDLCREADVDLIEVADPERDRRDPADYPGAVGDWHAARAAAWGEVIEARGGIAGFLVWGDPALYDSTIRVVQTLGIPYDVVPGVSAPQLLAARHGIVLHEVGQPLLVTTGRRLVHDAKTHDNLLVMLDGSFKAADLTVAPETGEWLVWWGANLGTASEKLVEGPLAAVAGGVQEEREAARREAGWVMDTYLLRRCDP